MSGEAAGVHFLLMTLDLISDPALPGDADLLRNYARTGSAEVFAVLVRRYADLVYSAARRQVRDPHVAEDVAQAVFILLSQRAGKIRQPDRLVGWLYQTTHFTAMNALKLEARRRRHERAFAARETDMANDPRTFDRAGDEWSEMSPVIDRAMAELDRPSRDLLLIRYFQGKSVQEVATAAGLSLDAAQKRLSRAIEKLRVLLGKKGVAVPAAAVGSALLARSVEAAPAVIHQSLLAASGAKVAASAGSAQILGEMRRWAAIHLLQMIGGGACAVAILGSLIYWLVQHRQSAGAPAIVGVVAAVEAAPVDDQTTRAAVSMWDPSLDSARIQKPWPMALAGSIGASPITADLFGDGKTEIIVPSMGVTLGRAATVLKAAHPHPTAAALVYAFYADGTTVPGFPVQLVSVQTRLIGQKKNSRWCEYWESSPGIVKIGGKDVIVVSGPDLTAQWDRALYVIHGDASVQTLRVGDWKPDQCPPVAVKLDPDGPIELLGSYAEIDGHAVQKSLMQSRLQTGFDVCIGDARGDGKLEFFQSGPKPNEFTSWNGVVSGYDQTGHMLPGWPQPVGGNSGLPTVMGDLLGDGKMEVVVPDGRDHILAWTADGKRFGSTYAEDPQKAKQDEARAGHPIRAIPKKELPTSILAEGLPLVGPLSLADLVGDGRAEIVFYGSDHTLRAIRGDGHGFGNADGILAKLPDDSHGAGVSIASLDGDNSMDFFVGTFWVHRLRDGTTTVTRMLGSATNRRAQPTIANIGGEAVVLSTTDDGRVFVYHTGKAYCAERVQWGTIDGDLEHTGCWHRAVAGK
jgi:RNA polymerase sigma factor (sigma-70 family)